MRASLVLALLLIGTDVAGSTAPAPAAPAMPRRDVVPAMPRRDVSDPAPPPVGPAAPPRKMRTVLSLRG